MRSPVVGSTTSSVQLTWAPSTDDVGVARYYVHMQFEDLGYGYQSETNSIEITGLPLRASRTYSFSVSAVDAAGNHSGYSPTLRVTLPPGDSVPPTTPGQPAAVEVAATYVRLQWSHSTDNIRVDRYDVLRITADGSTVVGSASQNPPGKNWSWVSGLTPSTTYTFAVRAVDEAGNLSGLSAPVTVTTTAWAGAGPMPAHGLRSANTRHDQR